MSKIKRWTYKELADEFVGDELAEIAGFAAETKATQRNVLRGARAIQTAAKKFVEGALDEWNNNFNDPLSDEIDFNDEGGSLWLGSIYAIAPSGKYGNYAVDVIFWDAVDELLPDGFSINSHSDMPDEIVIYGPGRDEE